MLTIFNRRNICTVFSMEEQANIRRTLSNNKIKYYIKTINNMHRPGRRRGMVGSAGLNRNLNYQYNFYVHKRDYDKAKYLISKL